MRFEGTEVMTLREAAQRYCTRPLPDDLFHLETSPPPADLADRACDAVQTRLDEVTRMRQIAVETEALLERLAELTHKPADFNRLIVRVDELRAQMQRHARTYNLVVQVAQLGELRRVQADRAIRDEAVETAENARRRLRRDREYVMAFIEGCDFLLGILPTTLNRLRERL
jgi:hypothetical protein